MAAAGKNPTVPVDIENEMRTSYLDYAMSVIVGRALPDARDGLKPVHRRVLFAMHELGNEWNKAPKKSARIVGDVIGKYHPHGDSAVYDTIVRMAQEFSLRYPLVDGQGNFGSIDGDPPAAMRYTECRLARIASEMLADIDKETVDFVPNYDETTIEPAVMPSRIPNLLINGSTGIAVGMATNIPPHNMGEICDALLAMIENPDIKIEKLLRIVTGPDFPTGGIIYGRQPIIDAYKTGRGILTVRAQAITETEERTGRTRIVVTEIPYQLNKTRLIEKIAELVNEKKLDGVSDLRDESDRDGMRIVIELKRDAIPLVVLNNLYKHTPMQESFGIILLALIGGRPRLVGLKDLLQEFLAHRQDIVTRATAFDLRKAEARLHLLDGLKIALDNLDAVIKLIRAAKDTPAAKDGLMSQFGLSEIQAQAILDMRLQRLTGLERDKILQEHAETVKTIARLRAILSDEREVLKIIAGELEGLKKQYGDERRTQIVDASGEITIEDMIVEEEMVVTVSHEGYIKRNPVTLYRQQRRGGRGKVGASTKGDDFVAQMFTASTHDYILFFTNRGRVYWKKVHEVPQAGRASRGKAIVNLLQLAPGEKLSAFLSVREFREDAYVLFATCRGIVKKTPLLEYSRPRSSGIIAITLAEDDELIAARLTTGNDQVALATRSGQLVRFNEGEVRAMGRGAGGVRGCNVDDDDRVVAMEIVRPGASLLTVSANGMGKRSSIDDYRLTRRGSVGVKTMNVTPKTGLVAGVLQIVSDEDEVMIVTDQGKMIRIAMENVRVMSRNTQGVTLVRLDQETGEHVVSVAPVVEKEAVGDEE
ncbi:MAG TPA: DNA gyrase subunit A [Candidatus Limnocylindrales bacterium]|nr:DNA gyrase subunit A [Candidatus Limnocylindrales bacterium]